MSVTINDNKHEVDSLNDYSEPTQDEMDKLLYDDLHIHITVNVSSDNDPIKVDIIVNINADDNYR